MEEYENSGETLSKAQGCAEVPMAPRSCPWETPALSQRLQDGWYPERQNGHSEMCWGVLVCRYTPPLLGERADPSLSCVPRTG